MIYGFSDTSDHSFKSVVADPDEGKPSILSSLQWRAFKLRASPDTLNYVKTHPEAMNAALLIGLGVGVLGSSIVGAILGSLIAKKGDRLKYAAIGAIVSPIVLTFSNGLFKTTETVKFGK